MCKRWLLGQSTPSPAYAMCHRSPWVLRCLKQMLLAPDFVPSRCQPDSPESWLDGLTCWDISLLFWIMCCRLRLSPCPLALVLFALFLLDVFSLQLPFALPSWLCSHGYSSATWMLPFALILCSYLTAGENPFVLWSQVLRVFVTSGLLDLPLIPFPALLLLWAARRKQSRLPGPSVSAQ